MPDRRSLLLLAAGYPRTFTKRIFVFTLAFLFVLMPLSEYTQAHKRNSKKSYKKSHKKNHKRRYKKRKARRVMPYRSALLIDAGTGRILRAYKPRKRILPASVVKMMTTLLVMEHIQDKKNHLSETVRVTRAAARVNGQQVYLRRGEKFRLVDLMKAVMITSANDAAYAVAEHVGGSASRFVRMMNKRARELGMTDSRFVNPNGLPPRRRRPANIMSARDASILARELIKHPRVLSWTSTRTATFRGRRHALVNTNRLMRRYPGMDGLKTGYYRRAGFNLVATAKRRNLRLISVVFGSRNSARRFRETKKLLTWGFSHHKEVLKSHQESVMNNRTASLNRALTLPDPLRNVVKDAPGFNQPPKRVVLLHAGPTKKGLRPLTATP